MSSVGELLNKALNVRGALDEIALDGQEAAYLERVGVNEVDDVRMTSQQFLYYTSISPRA